MGLLSWLGLEKKPRRAKARAPSVSPAARALAGWLGKRVRISAAAGLGDGLRGEVARVELDKVPIAQEILVRLDDGRGVRLSSNHLEVDRGRR